MNQSYIACVAGKSGGHIIPCFSYARMIKKEEQSILFFSNDTSLDFSLIEGQPDVAVHQALSLNAYFSLKGIFSFIFNFARALFIAFKQLRRYRPTEIISTGGIVSLPVFIAGWVLQIPCVLFELNAVPGKASRWCAPFAQEIHVCFKHAASFFASKKIQLTPYPLQAAVHKASMQAVHNQSPLKTILVLGGSQGSIAINNLIKKLCITHPEINHTFQIMHQTGSNDTTDWQRWYATQGITATVFAFETNLIPRYQHANIIIARAGAGTLFEIIAFKKPCIIIPLETVQTDHQVDNALAIAQEYPELCTVLREAEVKKDGDLLWKEIKRFSKADCIKKIV